jgi:hypothetical protein
VADPKKQPAAAPAQQPADDRAAEVRALAATIYAGLLARVAGKTPESLAADALSAARAFYRACDSDQQPAGLGAPPPNG